MTSDLVMEIQELIRKLDISIRMIRKTGTDFAIAEREHAVLLSQESLKLRDDGMAVTMIDKVVNGLKPVADAKFEKTVAEAVYKANLEAVNAIKLNIKIKDSQLGREWVNPPSS